MSCSLGPFLQTCSLQEEEGEGKEEEEEEKGEGEGGEEEGDGGRRRRRRRRVRWGRRKAFSPEPGLQPAGSVKMA